jgi:hypothetical protein
MRSGFRFQSDRHTDDNHSGSRGDGNREGHSHSEFDPPSSQHVGPIQPGFTFLPTLLLILASRHRGHPGLGDTLLCTVQEASNRDLTLRGNCPGSSRQVDRRAVALCRQQRPGHQSPGAFALNLRYSTASSKSTGVACCFDLNYSRSHPRCVQALSARGGGH